MVWIGVIGFISVISVGVMFCKVCKALLHNVLCLWADLRCMKNANSL